MTNLRNDREVRARLLLGLLLSEIYEDECATELLRSVLLSNPGTIEAHIELGIIYCRMEAYEQMVQSFKEAVRLDPQAVRVAVCEESQELETMRQILYTKQPAHEPAEAYLESVMPAYLREAGELVGLAREYLGAGRDREAVQALEQSLKLDPTFPYALAMLSLAYLLLEGRGGAFESRGEKSVLGEIAPALSSALFKVERMGA